MILRDFQAGYEDSPGIVAGVTMTVPPGCVTAVIGPNGSGKSTLLKGIMGFPGTVSNPGAFLDSRPLGTIERRERAALVGYLPQFPPVPHGLTGLETVLLGRHPHRDPWSADSPSDRAAAMEALELVGAGKLADKQVNRISGGEFRLVNLAGVLAQETPVILLDEPASSLDYGHAAELWEILSRLAAGGRTIVATTHRIGMAGGSIQQILLLSEGRPAGFGSPDSILSRGDLMAEVYGSGITVVRNPAGKGWVVCPRERG